MSDLILYTTEDGRSQIKLRTKDQSIWLTQREMAELFDISTDNVGLHLKNLFEDGELSREATTEDSSVVASAADNGEVLATTGLLKNELGKSKWRNRSGRRQPQACVGRRSGQ